MKKLLCAILACTLCLSLVGCDSGLASGNPKDVITSMLNNYKNQNFDALNKYFDGKVTFTDDLTMHGQLDAADKAMTKLFLDRLTDIDFEVLNETVDESGNNSVVTIQITTHNVGEKLLEGVKAAVPLALNLAFSGKSETEIKNELFTALLTPVQNTTKTNIKTVDINLVQKGNEWKISSNNFAFINSITGGFMDITNQLNFLN